MVKLDEGLASDVKPVIAGCAHALAREFYGYTTAADIAQELWVWVLKHQKKVSDWLEREEQDERNRGARALQKTLMRVGVVHCRREKAAMVGYFPHDEYFYSRSLLAALITAQHNGGKMIVNVVDDAPRKTKLDSEGNDVLAMLADLDRALEDLSVEQRHLVIEVHGFGVSVSDIADREQVTRQAVENRLNRALDRMIKFLGGEYPY